MNLTLYAKWRLLDEITVTYDCMFGTEPVRMTYYAGETPDPPTLPTREGWEFQGWYSGDEADHLYSFDTPLTKDLNLYAEWEKLDPVRVLFDRQDGSAPEAQWVRRGESLEEPEAPEREGYAFDGCVRPQTVVLPESVKEIGEWVFDLRSIQDGPVHIFYAGSRGQWEAVNIYPNNNLDGAVLHYNCPESGELETVFFNSRGGSPVEDQLRLEGELLEEPLAPERAGYTFTGWYRDDGASFFWTPPGGLWESVWF